MPEKVSHTPGFEEILWNFVHLKDERCVTLQDNPHFYSELPTALDAYTPQFEALPVDKFELKPNATIYVLVDQRRRVFLETKQETRIFGNVFTLKDAKIFKGSFDILSIPRSDFDIPLDIHGALEGESVVAGSIKGFPNFERSEELFVVPNSTTYAYNSNLWPIVTANLTPQRTSQDRIDLIQSALGPGDNDVHIYVGRLPPMWTTRTEVSHDEPDPRILHITHASIWHRFRRP